MSNTTKILGVKKVNKKTTEYFSCVENGEVKYTDNPMRSFTSSDSMAVEVIREILQAGDKRNTYESFEIKLS